MKFPYVTFTRAAAISGVSRQRFIRAFRVAKLREFPIEGSDMVVIDRKDIPKAKDVALAQKRGRPKRKGR